MKTEWNSINDAKDNYVALITENAKCNAPDGDRTSRQPWHIKAAAFDDSNNIVTLTAEPKTWENAFSHWPLKVDSRGLLPRVPHPRHRLAKRLSIGIDPKTILPTAIPTIPPTTIPTLIPTTIKGSPASLNLAGTITSDPIDIPNDSGETVASFTCNSCHTPGSLDFLMDVTFSLPNQLNGPITMTPTDVAALITAQLSLKDDSIHGAQISEVNLLTVPVDGISIGGVANIGPAFKIDLIAGIDSANAQVNLPSSVNMSIPADAKAVLDLSDSNNNQVSGWMPVFQHNTPNNQLSGEDSITAFVTLQWRTELDFGTVSKGIMAGLALDLPELDFTVTPMGNTVGNACGVVGQISMLV